VNKTGKLKIIIGGKTRRKTGTFEVLVGRVNETKAGQAAKKEEEKSRGSGRSLA